MDWDTYWFGIMEAVSKKASCDRGKSGCVIVKNNRLLSIGYVGMPEGLATCDDVGHLFELRSKLDKDADLTKIKYPKTMALDQLAMDKPFSVNCTRQIHAEENAILCAARRGISIEGSTLYCRMTPCYRCALQIISVGIKEVKCQKLYHAGAESIKMFNKKNILISHIHNEIQQY